MKKLYKITAIILSVILIFSVFATVSFAADKAKTPETTVSSEKESKDDTTQKDKEKKTYKECLDEKWEMTWDMITGNVDLSEYEGFGFSYAYFGFIFIPVLYPLKPLLKVIIPVAGILNTVFVPLEAGIMYLNQ